MKRVLGQEHAWLPCDPYAALRVSFVRPCWASQSQMQGPGHLSALDKVFVALFVGQLFHVKTFFGPIFAGSLVLNSIILPTHCSCLFQPHFHHLFSFSIARACVFFSILHVVLWIWNDAEVAKSLISMDFCHNIIFRGIMNIIKAGERYEVHTLCDMYLLWNKRL